MAKAQENNAGDNGENNAGDNAGRELVVTGNQVGGTDVASVTVGGLKIKIKKAVSVPTLKHETGQTLVVRFDLPISTKIKETKKTVVVAGENVEAVEKTEISVGQITDFNSGTNFEYVCNTITVTTLREAYPDDSYVGKWFAITKGGVREGKRYKTVDIQELDISIDAETGELQV